jgi:hypothetical protein
MNEINITEAQYQVDSVSNEITNIKAIIDGVEIFVPIAVGNRHYDEIMRQVEAGTLTIADAD